MASEKNLNAVFSDIANSIRSKKGTTGTIQPINMASEIDSIETGGGDIDALIDGSITEITSNVASIRPYSFYQCKNLTTVNLPNISTIPDYAFYQCENLAIANFSPTNITTIGNWAFSGCYKLTSYNFPEVTTIESYAFNGYRGSEAIFPKATKVGYYAFNGGQMTIIDFPLLTSTSNSEFRYCRHLVTINLPQLKNIGNNTFDGDEQLTTVVFPEVTEISGWAFNKCLNLETVDLPKAKRVGGSEVFYYCPKLTTLILRANEVATLGSSNVFNYTPIKTSTTEGFIYVPDNLVDSYKSATNWSAYASKIKGLSELGE